MENTNLSQEAIAIKQLDEDIESQQGFIEQLEKTLASEKAKLIRLVERQKNIKNYLNTDNSKA